MCYALFYVVFPISSLNIGDFDNIFTLNISKPKNSDIELEIKDEKNSYEDYINEEL
jgi:hypothetical protein